MDSVPASGASVSPSAGEEDGGAPRGGPKGGGQGDVSFIKESPWLAVSSVPTPWGRPHTLTAPSLHPDMTLSLLTLGSQSKVRAGALIHRGA